MDTDAPIARPNEPLCEKHEKILKTLLTPRCPIRSQHMGIGCVSNLKQLSATDILTLALMKNAAKYDTWYELQNPLNHRVFKSKLHWRPLCRGHDCLGITHSVTLRLHP
ncbi:Hypothetical predicted protein [Olea europaea subsp. europaea]|uniref:Uncharacterized protein n=1 Tax=Olea europaea subsp. europaea TaxID=158383 RepID=A0A8S0PJ08_OLEEU|nr:Hypothetical predicted protein [Olea europaea subsp. europaea]